MQKTPQCVPVSAAENKYFRQCYVCCCLRCRKNALQPQFEHQLQLPQLNIHFSLPELLLSAYVGASWLQPKPCPSRFLDLSVMDDVFSTASGK